MRFLSMLSASILILFLLVGCTVSTQTVTSTTTFTTMTTMQVTNQQEQTSETETTQPETTTEPSETTMNPIITPITTPNITLSTGKGAFYGRMTWGDMPVNNGTIIAETQNPAIIQIPGTQWEAQRFTTTTDSEGNYVLIVDAPPGIEPKKYYLGSSLPDSEYLTYISFGQGLIGVLGEGISSGEFVLMNFVAIDWSIVLVSPASPISKPEYAITVNNNTPTLSWQEYDWQRYSSEKNYRGYYMVNIYDDNGYTILSDTSGETSYNITNPLQKGKYQWDVCAFTKSGEKIADTENEAYFVVP
jgi:hypothetical protein